MAINYSISPSSQQLSRIGSISSNSSSSGMSGNTPVNSNSNSNGKYNSSNSTSSNNTSTHNQRQTSNDNYENEHEQEHDPISVVDTLLAKELNGLSFQDRNNINEEIHGVSCLAIEETPDLVERALAQLQVEIDTHIGPNEKQAYLQSQQPPLPHEHDGTTTTANSSTTTTTDGTTSYVNSYDFRLRFLRIELFDISRAAVKLVSYLNTVLELFGVYALYRPIQLADFSDSELQKFRLGNLQLLPFRDRSGRRIITGVEGLAIQFDSKLRYKILFYLMWAAGDYNDEETQKRGVVVIIWPVSDVAMQHITTKAQKSSLIEKQTNYLKGCPVRVCAFHFCVPDRPFFHFLKMVFAYTLDNTKKTRLKYHVGQVMELQYLVKGYGIPVDHIPLTDTGNVKTQNLRIWMKLRTTLEKGSSHNNNNATAAAAATESPESSNTMHGSLTSSTNSNNSYNSSYIHSNNNSNSNDISTSISCGNTTDTSASSYSSMLSTSSASVSSSSIIDCPGSNDVLFRPSKLIKGHPGNVKFQSFIEYEHEYVHENGLDYGVTKSSKRIIQAIQEQQPRGRVLIWNKQGQGGREGWWTHLTDEVQILFKVSVSFRDYKQKKKAKVQINDSSTYAFCVGPAKKRKKRNSCGTSSSNKGNSNNNSNGSNIPSSATISATTAEITATTTTPIENFRNNNNSNVNVDNVNVDVNVDNVLYKYNEQQQQKRLFSFF